MKIFFNIEISWRDKSKQILNLRHLIRTIKRKNYNKESVINNLSQKEEDDKKLFECISDNSKKFSKTEIDAILQYLIKTVNETNEKQKLLEQKVEILSKQNDEFLIQNQQIYQELLNKKYFYNLILVIILRNSKLFSSTH